MSDKAFVDTNILIYARVPALGDKHIAARELVQISFWDALIVQAAEIAGAKVLYTEDLSQARLMEACWPSIPSW